MVYSYSRGWKIVWDEVKQAWLWEDTKKSVKEERPCKHCGRMPTSEGYDACLGYIKNAKSACCGHGEEESFVVF